MRAVLVGVLATVFSASLSAAAPALAVVPAAALSKLANSSVLAKGEYPFPCDNPPIQWMCNTTQFCNAANRMKADGCWFMPYFCDDKCHVDIKTLASTDCVENPGNSPFLERIADEVDEQLRLVFSFCFHLFHLLVGKNNSTCLVAINPAPPPHPRSSQDSMAHTAIPF